jgi:flagellar basal body rod protein FlgC
MVLEGLLNIAKSGMNTQIRAFDRASEVIANPQAFPEKDISEALLDTQMAVLQFNANAIVFETGVEFWEMLSMIKQDDE